MVSNNPLVSVLIPVKNGLPYISFCLDSLIRQSYTNYEILICDDGSTDDTFSILTHYASRFSNIFFFQNQTSRGISFSLNRLIRNAKGLYLLRMDAMMNVFLTVF